MDKFTGETVAQFGTLCGATVDLIRLDEPRGEQSSHAWTCRGCGDGVSADHVVDARRRANAHARECRSLPRPATA